MAAQRHPAELLDEVRKMRSVPGIVFADEVSGRVPRIAGTGLEVFEVITTYEAVDRSWERLMAAFHWLTPEQLRSAVAYYEAFPEDVLVRMEQQQRTLDRLGWKEPARGSTDQIS
jgi:uncharacterized protein (DUF433 family)